ncbi:hypothetical protein LTR85_010373 [Meristemomyces frigidus]|nr:hypothetical protein LTR85_010373 [Meristemomyces frigidus]
MSEASPRLYVGNLPYVAQKADIEMLFAESNVPIKSIDISIDPFNGRNPSYCFVDFHSQDEANQAMQTMQGQRVRGRPIKINLKTERRDGGAARDRLATKTHDRGWRAQDVPSLAVNENAHVYDRWSRDDAASRWTAPLDEGRRLYVGGLPQVPNQDSLNAEMRVLFQGWNIEAVSKIISPPEYKRHLPGSHHFCFVDMPSAREAEDAIAMLNGKKTPYGGSYQVQIGRPSKRPTKVMREQLGYEDPGKKRSRSPKRELQGSWRRQG